MPQFMGGVAGEGGTKHNARGGVDLERGELMKIGRGRGAGWAGAVGCWR
jgi:hypothetical protein